LYVSTHYVYPPLILCMSGEKIKDEIAALCSQ